ncbi:glucose-6-phosphate isomerase [Parasphingorhabdus marina DSM 22363]|uniref:Glucose-6-phosphate isomerase n=1 Tax=Parasphingorhabdus marina DSM 22363 TaxID=1123272 RepID=A0A1N6FMQ1_9SPHN|nr:glucose-6-phosphate isomerase [Parasphingorhabdus marina]SIN96569.1 glucose-6-phosphate isomerase [Parasphingorhabdus marina DSM 22363]
MADWNSIKNQPRKSLTALFDQDTDRVGQFSFEQSGILFDFSKTHLDGELISAFQKLSEELAVSDRIQSLLAGETVNPSEGRAAEHSAERGIGDPDSVHMAGLLRSRMAGLIKAIDAGALGEIRHVIHLGIGGSALGPELLLQTLSLGDEKYETAVVSNIDGSALEPVLERFEAARTLLVIASKSFTTAETLLNAQSVMDWMREEGESDPFGRIVALTAKPDKAVEWGIDESRILPFSETIGGRYSLWSSIGFSVALTVGFEVFEDLLAGAAEMDRHFADTPPEQNIPVLAAWCDQFYAQVREYETRAVFVYDERLGLLPDYLQQLEMESNGKSVKLNGEPIDGHSGSITWGGVGTDAQHAVFQLLHQGTHVVPVEFLAVIEPGHSLQEAHHKGLLLNCFGQAAALMAGKTSDDPNRNYPGDRPSTTILLDRLDGKTLGALIAFYEHRTFVNAAMLEINPFDQFGVELGKEMANQLMSGDGNKMDPSTEQLKKRAFPA